MASLYERMFDDIPLYAVPGTEDSDVIEYETNMQRNTRLLREQLIGYQMEEITRLQIQMTQTGPVWPLEAREATGMVERMPDDKFQRTVG